MTTEQIAAALVGSYKVKIGPKGGCNSAKPNSTAKTLAKIEGSGTTLTSTNECGSATSLQIVDDKTLMAGSDKVSLRISGKKVVISGGGNTWTKVN